MIYKVPTNFYELLELNRILDKRIETKNRLEGMTKLNDIESIKFNKINRILDFKKSYGTYQQREKAVSIMFEVASIINKDTDRHFDIINHLNDLDLNEINIVYKNLGMNTLVLKLIHFLSDHRATLKDFIDVYAAILDRIDLNKFCVFKIYHNSFCNKMRDLDE